MLLWPQRALAQIQRVKYVSGDQHLMVEFLDDDLVHFEVSAFGPGPDVNQSLYSSPMVTQDGTDYSGPQQFFSDGNGNLETTELKVQVNPQTLCLTVTDQSKEPALVLTTICPLHLKQEEKGITIAPHSFTHVYGLGQQFITPGFANGDWVGQVRSPGGPFGNALVHWNGGAVGNNQFPIAYFLGHN